MVSLITTDDFTKIIKLRVLQLCDYYKIKCSVIENFDIFVFDNNCIYGMDNNLTGKQYLNLLYKEEYNEDVDIGFDSIEDVYVNAVIKRA